MTPFEYTRAATPKAAVTAHTREPNAQFIAGGTNLIDLMKRGITRPGRIVDINKLPLRDIDHADGMLRIGALATNAQVADDKLVLRQQPLLAQAINAGASAQLRNMATVGGNLLQRTRCPYFYDISLPCNKREPGSGCGALEGFNRMHAIFGHSDQCIAVNPSDMSVGLVALDAVIQISGPKRDRTVPIADFHRLPGSTPEQDTVLEKGELITAVHIPDAPFAGKVHYLKIRDRASYAFALVSVAAALELDGRHIRDARLAMGGVAHKPWRLKEAEQALRGKEVSDATFRQAAETAMRGARAFRHNAFKLKLAPNAIVEALKTAAGTA